jgi:hypothetical protein
MANADDGPTRPTDLPYDPRIGWSDSQRLEDQERSAMKHVKNRDELRRAEIEAAQSEGRPEPQVVSPDASPNPEPRANDRASDIPDEKLQRALELNAAALGFGKDRAPELDQTQERPPNYYDELKANSPAVAQEQPLQKSEGVPVAETSDTSLQRAQELNVAAAPSPQQQREQELQPNEKEL